MGRVHILWSRVQWLRRVQVLGRVDGRVQGLTMVEEGTSVGQS